MKNIKNIDLESVYELLKTKDLNDKINYNHPDKTNNKSINMSVGRIWFNCLLPDDYPLVDEPITQSKSNQIIIDILNKYDTNKASLIINKIQKESFKLTTLFPNSFKIEALVIPDELTIEKNNLLKNAENYSIIEYNKKCDELAKKLVDYLRNNNIKIQNVMDGGVKGDPIGDWKILLVSRGYVLDIENNILGPIKQGTAEGYNKKDYYNASASARRGFYYKSLMTAKPGYLSRKVTMANASLYIQEKPKDCGTKKYYNLYVNDKNAKLIFGRNCLISNKIVNIDDEIIKTIKNTTIKLRSPLYCKQKEGICPTCYGTLYQKLNTKNIGILAGGAINQIAVNSLMKLRHKSSQFEIIEVDFNKILNNTGININTFNNYLTVKKDEIYCKKPFTIILDENDYDDEVLSDLGDRFLTPGIINVSIDENESITLPFNFKVNLKKPTDYIKDGNTHVMNFQPNELLIFQKYYTKELDPAVIDRLLEGSAKYINKPELLVETIHEQLPTCDLIHLELIVSNMFRTLSDETLPCRLDSYNNFQLIGVKKLPFINSWLSSLSFENPNKAITTGLLSGKDAEMNPFEKVVLEKHFEDS